MAQPVDFPRYPFHGQIHFVPESASSYVFDKSRDSWYFRPLSAGGGSGGAGSVTISAQPPSTAENGSIWVDSSTYYMYVFDETVANSGRWIGITNNGGNNTMVHIGTTPPEGNSMTGQFWFDAATGDLKILYSDSDSTQWVTITSNGQSLGVNSALLRIMQGQIDDLQGQMSDIGVELQSIDNRSDAISLE